jgi:hypothetical protein
LSGDDCEENSLFATGPGAESVEVDATTLDRFADRQGLRRIDLLKVDVEGAEVRVLRGGERVLGGAVAPVLIIEVNPSALRAAGSDPAELYDQLDALGYAWRVVEKMPWKGEVTLNLVAYKRYYNEYLDRFDESLASLTTPEPP